MIPERRSGEEALERIEKHLASIDRSVSVISWVVCALAPVIFVGLIFGR